MATRNQIDLNLSGQTGTGSFVGSNSPTLVTPTLGVSSATSINFGGNALSNYLQGTWVSTITFATPGDLSVVYTTQTGVYTRIGDIVLAQFQLNCTPTYTTASGQFQVAGLPLSAANSNDTGAISIQTVGVVYPAGCTKLVFTSTAAASVLSFVGLGSAVASAPLTTVGVPSGTVLQISGSILYHV